MILKEILDRIPSARDDVYFHLMGNDTLDEAKLLMGEKRADRMRRRVDTVYRAESRRVFATLIRRLGDFDLAEEALHDAFRAALEQWPRDGEPANPRAWLTSVGRFKAIDRIRRRARFDPLDSADSGPVIASIDDFSGKETEDDLLRLIFTCCHPALSPDARIALTLREVCGFTTETIGLLALMLLQESRHAARTSPSGDLILLEDQDRALWNRELIGEGLALVDRALSSVFLSNQWEVCHGKICRRVRYSHTEG